MQCIDSNEFFVSFVAFCVFLIRFRVPVGSGQNHARYPVGWFHLKPVHKTFYTKQTKETKNFVLRPFPFVKCFLIAPLHPRVLALRPHHESSDS